MRFNLIFSSYLCLLGDLCLASLSTKLGKTINFTNNIMTRKKTTPMGGAVMDQNPHQLRKKITFGPNTVQLIILFVTPNNQTTNLVFTIFFHEFFSAVAFEEENILIIGPKQFFQFVFFCGKNFQILISSKSQFAVAVFKIV